MSPTLFNVVYFIPLALLGLAALLIEKKLGKQIFDKLTFWMSMALFVIAIVLAFTRVEIEIVRTIAFCGFGHLAVAGVSWCFITMTNPKLRRREGETDN